MITTLRGQIIQLEENAIVLEVGGVGLRLLVPQPLLGRVKIGESIMLQTHLVVREDALTLYGFDTTIDRSLFTMLLGVDGVGPKAALAVLSTLDFETVQSAVYNDQYEILNRVPGVGKKTAQKIILYLKDRLKPVSGLDRISSMSDADSEVMAALTALGYSVVEAQRALQGLPRDAPDNVEDRLRLALQNI
ncbi:MAG: Holliday junction DNA helicase RuvA [Chloroflexi bacterium GWB2_49_20]|nr:MAG: Holliday junction DNA helicase RuvA [Chloroflexi bacterium GWB2_49_20]OGN76722.1 MAG: Holliday junction DNA helicase RuvA [Chloroflexi bacterium GWC2_49_37]OGN83682.1 MAG: Holliday junction DNA helicase RuvA [Chloroflexi bacterium GWD2_49_16]HBG74196.1 Holliday junction branch migration protein RuvA [Anaerolineae bacterium]HCC78987.1 Holliday junction branch migration protein RuvA [Anaerolineae bacterium]